MHGVYLEGKTCASSNFTSMSRRPAAAASSESCRFVARPGLRRLPLTSCWRRQQVTHQPAQQSRGVAHLQHCRPFSSATAVSGNAVCAMQTAIMCEGVPPMIRLLHMLPSWPVGRWEHGILGHWRAISARQRDRSGGAAMGVGLEKEWRGSAAD